LSRSLAALSADDWWTALSQYLDFYLGDAAPHTPTVDAMRNALNMMTNNLDNTEVAKHPRYVTRTIACSLLWLAKTDLHTCINLLINWLDDADPDHELSPLIGSAGAQLLFNVYAYHEQSLPLDPYAEFLALLPPLARNLNRRGDEDGIWTAFNALR